MIRKNTNYNKMAPFYNKITNFISEGGNIRSQRYFLQYVKQDDHVLNIGCGSVQFNVDIATRCNWVQAIDIADRMIQIAKKRIKGNHLEKNIKFICRDIMKYETEEKYDVIFANFFLNTFEWEYATEVLSYIITFLKEDGILCIADEHKATKTLPKLSQILFRTSISWMHHIWAGHPMHKVYNYYEVMQNLGYTRMHYKIDETDIIDSSIYKKICMK